MTRAAITLTVKRSAGADCGRFPTWPKKAAQAEKQPGRKDAHRKPLLPHLYSKTKPNFRFIFYAANFKRST